MNERWKYQIRIGLLWSVITLIIIAFMESEEMSFFEQFTTPKGLLRLISLPIIGIFIFGYFMWKQKNKKSDKQ
jgi:hypothetical protein